MVVVASIRIIMRFQPSRAPLDLSRPGAAEALRSLLRREAPEFAANKSAMSTLVRVCYTRELQLDPSLVGRLRPGRGPAVRLGAKVPDLLFAVENRTWSEFMRQAAELSALVWAAGAVVTQMVRTYEYRIIGRDPAAAGLRPAIPRYVQAVQVLRANGVAPSVDVRCGSAPECEVVMIVATSLSMWLAMVQAVSDLGSSDGLRGDYLDVCTAIVEAFQVAVRWTNRSFRESFASRLPDDPRVDELLGLVRVLAMVLHRAVVLASDAGENVGALGMALRAQRKVLTAADTRLVGRHARAVVRGDCPAALRAALRHALPEFPDFTRWTALAVASPLTLASGLAGRAERGLLNTIPLLCPGSPFLELFRIRIEDPQMRVLLAVSVAGRLAQRWESDPVQRFGDLAGGARRREARERLADSLVAHEAEAIGGSKDTQGRAFHDVVRTLSDYLGERMHLAITTVRPVHLGPPLPPATA